ncbi:GrpB family protein [Pirellulaceae bacterium]|nr:GrpB family protein [Pirellulaceae bacterium]
MSFLYSKNVCHQHVVIVDYDQRWIESYQRESENLKEILGTILIAVHHIGSTSVNGLAAKPVVDILLEVSSVIEIDNIQAAIRNRGYQFWGEYGITGRRYLTKGTDPRTHHIHSYKAGDKEIDRHLAYRDYLRTHPTVAAEYESLKRRVASQCNHDIEKYCAGKDAFIKHHEQLALKYAATLKSKSSGE